MTYVLIAIIILLLAYAAWLNHAVRALEVTQKRLLISGQNLSHCVVASNAAIQAVQSGMNSLGKHCAKVRVMLWPYIDQEQNDALTGELILITGMMDAEIQGIADKQRVLLEAENDK